MSEQRVLTIDEVIRLNPKTTAIWATPSVRAKVESIMSFPILQAFVPVPTSLKTLIVIGGGTIIDEAKVWRLEQASKLELVAIPSIWGSGAEASPIAVRNRSGKKDIRIDSKLLPNARAICPDFAASIPPDRVKYACGDCWAHALEGFLSPLAAEALRAELAALIGRMLAAPIDNNPVWFELSAQACAGQARSSVGLAHGIAHTLEGSLQAQQPDVDWGHARLCSLFLWPVMCFNGHASSKWSDLLAQHNLPLEPIQNVLRAFYDKEAYDLALPALKANWIPILRDPCTRTNSALVRPGSLDFFVNKAFQ
jgi:alcohol dehydrogenase class IV